MWKGTDHLGPRIRLITKGLLGLQMHLQRLDEENNPSKLSLRSQRELGADLGYESHICAEIVGVRLEAEDVRG